MERINLNDFLEVQPQDPDRQGPLVAKGDDDLKQIGRNWCDWQLSHFNEKEFDLNSSIFVGEIRNKGRNLK